MEAQIALAEELGINMLLTPILHRLLIPVGGERTTVQLIDILQDARWILQV